MDDETLHTDYALLKDCAALDELIGWFASQYRYATNERELILAERKRLSPDQVRANLAQMRKLKDPDKNLMFAGHAAYNFGTDPFYSNGFVPTVKQLVDRILTGD